MKRPGSGPEVFEIDQIGSPYSLPPGGRHRRQRLRRPGGNSQRPDIIRSGLESPTRVLDSYISREESGNPSGRRGAFGAADAELRRLIREGFKARHSRRAARPGGRAVNVARLSDPRRATVAKARRPQFGDPSFIQRL
jgi:hypothetical protein